MVALGAALVLGGVGCGGSTSAAVHGLLFLRSEGEGYGQIFLWRPGSAPKPIGPGGYNIDDAEWSPDGSLIAFTRSEMGGTSNFSDVFAIYVMRPYGTKVRQLSDGFDDGPFVSDDFPSWSPDSRQIVFSRSVGTTVSRDGFVTVDVRSGRERSLIRTSAYAPVWGKPGIAYGQFDSAIQLLNPVTGRSRLLTRRVTRAYLAWSPSGVLAMLEPSEITQGHRSGNRIVFFSAAGRVLGELPAPVGKTFECGPVWSPNGKQIHRVHTVP